jgi:NADH:ubiquinone oxidoreductase subunit E
MTAPEIANTDNWSQVEAASKAALPPFIVDFIEQCRRESHSESQLIAVLHKVQGHFGFLDRPQLDAVAQLLQVPLAKVTGVATFYHFFRLQPRGRFIISLCLGTACYVKGAPAIAEKLKEELGIEFGETTQDGMFTLQIARCLGTCGLAPVLTVNDDVHAAVKPDHIPAMLEKYRNLPKT